MTLLFDPEDLPIPERSIEFHCFNDVSGDIAQMRAEVLSYYALFERHRVACERRYWSKLFSEQTCWDKARHIQNLVARRGKRYVIYLFPDICLRDYGID